MTWFGKKKTPDGTIPNNFSLLPLCVKKSFL
jgi:hypothetical protein